MGAKRLDEAEARSCLASGQQLAARLTAALAPAP
jgi:hypothetical protein